MRQKFAVFVLFVFVIVGVSFGNPAQEGKKGAHYFEVSPSVVMVKHEYGANITCIATDQGLYFVDCGMSTELSTKFRLDMEKKFARQSKALLITHAHIDHFLGMAAFRDIDVIAAEAGKALWQRQLAIDFTPPRIEAYTRIFPKFSESIKTAKPFLPTQWIKEKMIIGKGKNQLIFTKTGGHSSCSSSVYFPAEKVLVAGDLVQVDQWPYFGDPTTDMKAWLTTFKQWEGLPINQVCAGHGMITDLGYVKLMRSYFEKMITALTKLKKQKVPIQQVVKHKDLPARYWGNSKPQPGWWNYCIASLYKKL